jgi:hypothetical protein
MTTPTKPLTPEQKEALSKLFRRNQPTPKEANNG